MAPVLTPRLEKTVDPTWTPGTSKDTYETRETACTGMTYRSDVPQLYAYDLTTQGSYI
jgi:hypothetical protein